jgi:hypothetical protein
MSTDNQQALNEIPPLDNAIADAIEGVDTQPVQQQEPELPEFEAPHHWGQEAKEAWKALHGYKEGRSHLERVHKQWGQTQGYLTKVEQERAQLRKQFEPLNEFLQPYSQQWAAQGMDTLGGLRQIMAFRDGLERDPQATMLQIAKMYGVDLGKMIEDQPYVPPEVQQLQQEFARVQEAQRQTQMQLQQSQQQQYQQYVLGQVQAFETEKDASGNLKHPHFAEVVNDMAALKAMGRASDNEELYRLAVQLNPKLNAEAVEAAKQAAIREAQAKNSSVAQTVAKNGVAKARPERGDNGGLGLDEAIRDAMKESN